MANSELTISDVYSLVGDTKWYASKVYDKVYGFLNMDIQSAVKKINDWSTQLQEKTIMSINQGFNQIAAFVLQTQNTVNSIARSVYSIESTVSHIADDVISNITMKLDSVVDDLTKKISDVTQTLSIVIDNVSQEIRQTSANIMSSINATKDYLNDKISEGTENVKRGISDLKDFTEKEFGTVIYQANQNLNTTLNTIESTTKSVLDQGQNLFKKTIDFVDQGISGLAQGFADLFENFQSFFGNIFLDFQKFLESIFLVDEDASMARLQKLTEKFIEIQRYNIKKDL